MSARLYLCRIERESDRYAWVETLGVFSDSAPGAHDQVTSHFTRLYLRGSWRLVAIVPAPEPPPALDAEVLTR